MDAQDESLSGSVATMASDGGPVCHLVQSPLFTLFHSLPISGCAGDGRAPPGLGRASGLRLPSLGDDPSSSQEAPCLLGSSYDAGGSVLASTTMVPRSSATLSRSTQTASFPSASSRDPQAVFSCLATVQRFTRAEGFSSRVATQVGFARRPSSRTNYQVKWSVYRRWCRVEGHSISRPTLLKVADFLFWLCRSRKLCVLYPGLSVDAVGGFSLLSCPRSPTLRYCVISCVLLRLKPLFVLSALLLGTWTQSSGT